jgi:hypothetical protein
MVIDMIPSQFRSMLDMVLKRMGNAVPYTRSARELLMLTAATESLLGVYLEQVGGPACGVFQMEPDTERDIWDNFLRYKPELQSAVMQFRSINPDIQMYELKYNLMYQVAMARMHYRRVKAAIPSCVFDKDGYLDRDSIHKMAEYWKQYYNTVKGKGKVEEAVSNYVRYAI